LGDFAGGEEQLRRISSPSNSRQTDGARGVDDYVTTLLGELHKPAKNSVYVPDGVRLTGEAEARNPPLYLLGVEGADAVLTEFGENMLLENVGVTGSGLGC
jgi:hypothetical protein